MPSSTPEMMRPTIQMTAICPLLICFRFLAGPGTGLAMRQARVARPRCVEFAYSIPQRRFFRIGSPEPSDRPTPTPPGLCGGACSMLQSLRWLQRPPWKPPLDSRGSRQVRQSKRGGWLSLTADRCAKLTRESGNALKTNRDLDAHAPERKNPLKRAPVYAV